MGLSTSKFSRVFQIVARFGTTLNAWLQPRLSAWQRLGLRGSLLLAVRPIVLAVRSIGWCALKIAALLSWVFAKLVTALRWLLVPKGDTPFDVLKHYVSVILGVIGLASLLWAGKQIAYPPIVITVAELPEPIRKEYWLNTEISRTLIDQIERMRAVVKNERDPTFEAVLNPPNIVVKSGEFSLNVQEQLLTPIGSLLGRSQGEVHLAVTCNHPGCLRTSDSECRDPILAPKPDEARGSSAPATGPKTPANPYLCLRVTADIRRGDLHKRVTTPLNLSNDTYHSETTKQMARIAQEITTVADPATAALYFYLRAKQASLAAARIIPADKTQSGSAVARNDADDENIVSEWRGDAFEAAEQAEAQDAVSACWAHSVRARLAIDRRDYLVAESYLARAEDIPWWRHLRQLTLPMRCRRLIAIVKTEFARSLAVSSPATSASYPLHSEDNNSKRSQASFERATKVVDGLGGGQKSSWISRVEKAIMGSDPMEAAAFARAEIGLSWLNRQNDCPVRSGGARTTVPNSAQTGYLDLSTQMRNAIYASVNAIETLDAGHRLPPLARQAALEFAEKLSLKKDCLDIATSLAERLYLRHPADPNAARLLAGLIERSALAETRKGDRLKGASLNRALRIYERMVDIGDDKTDVFTLGRLALIRTAFEANWLDDDEDLDGPPREILRDVKRAWQRFERELYPIEVRHHAETSLALWGSLLLTFYPQAIFSTELTQKAANPKQKDASEKTTDFLRAAQVLFPTAQAKRLEDLATISGIGPRIGCLCVLARMAGEELRGAEFYLARVDIWQRSRFGFRDLCIRDLTPDDDDDEPRSEEKKAELEEKKTALDKAKNLCHIPKND